MSLLCIAGCGRPADVRHHIIFQQELRRVAGRDKARADTLRGDPRGMVPVCQECHERLHSRSRPLPLAVLPDEAFVFAVEVLGAGRAFNYLQRTCSGSDPRLDALLTNDREAA